MHTVTYILHVQNVYKIIFTGYLSIIQYLFKNTLFSLQIGGIELDLGKLIKVIKDMGGMENVVEKKKWHKVADIMGIPKCVSILH